MSREIDFKERMASLDAELEELKENARRLAAIDPHEATPDDHEEAANVERALADFERRYLTLMHEMRRAGFDVPEAF